MCWGVSVVRMIALTLAALLLLTATALAVAPVNAATIKAAQEYGRVKAEASLTEFFQGWTVYEEKAPKLDETAERACLYTPFLLIAADARDRTLGGGPVTAADAERVLTDYNGYIIVGVTLFGDRPDFVAKLSALLRQGRKTVKPALVQPSPPAAEKAADRYQAHFYLYFPVREVAQDRAATLTINVDDKRPRSFFIPLADLR